MQPERRGKLLMDCLGVLAAAHAPGCAPSMAQFRIGLHGRLRALLPDDLPVGALGDVELLDSDGQLADEAHDLYVEYAMPISALDGHWSWAKVSAELEERRIYEKLRRLPEREYTEARGLIVKHVSGELSVIRKAWDGKLTQFNLYEPVSAWTGHQIRGYWFACPTCRWPMRVERRGGVFEVRCEAHARDGVKYSCDIDDRPGRAPQLQPAGAGAKAVRAVPATADHLALSRIAWRYVALPGLLECELRDFAKGLKARVTMWPHKDRYDLRIVLGGQTWKVDAKAWADVQKLGEALQKEAENPAKPTEPGLIIVIPDHQAAGRDMLHHMIKGLEYRALTAQGLKNELLRRHQEGTQ